jgi:hypothetical protein
MSGRQVRSDIFKTVDANTVRMYLLKNGEVLEEMRGRYSGYGDIEEGTCTYHMIKNEKGLPVNVLSKKYKAVRDVSNWQWTDWDGICNDFLFTKTDKTGIAVILESEFRDCIPTTVSEDDPDQGWEMEQEDDDDDDYIYDDDDDDYI